MTTTSSSSPSDLAQPGRIQSGRAAVPARTLRTDRWWVSPLVTAIVLGVFIVYTTVRLFMRNDYWVGEYHYLTPLYSPCLSVSCAPGSSHLGTPLPAFPLALPLPILIFPILAGFRASCYYYRKAGYRAFLLSPPGCAVTEPARKYRGETRLPLVLQNLHRYFFYFASALLLINTYDAVSAFFPADGGFGVGLGSLILLVNVTMLWLYSLSCHACRHVFGGRLKHFSQHPMRYWFWTHLSKLNGRHMQFAWASLITVMLTDFYIMAVSAGWIADLRLFN
ncbi:MAG: hypothetical protein JO364_02555 [Pseudonocardiales bacterium]|nr:hypothetical protein [Pseudonocardiales bacterium]MBV9029192.1 hypothetical protein [Pseudonocardiales bacterium]